MNTRVETVNVKLDTLKIAVALLVALGGVVGFYLFAGESTLVRVLGLLACMGAAAGIAYQTDQGRALWVFFQEAQVEVRKVVWPTRQETVQTTGIVLVMVIIFAVGMWLLDLVLGAGIQALMGTGG